MINTTAPYLDDAIGPPQASNPMPHQSKLEHHTSEVTALTSSNRFKPTINQDKRPLRTIMSQCSTITLHVEDPTVAVARRWLINGYRAPMRPPGRSQVIATNMVSTRQHTMHKETNYDGHKKLDGTLLENTPRTPETCTTSTYALS